MARLVLMSGSTRRQSTNTAALVAIAESLGPAVAVFAPILTEFPAFDPDLDVDPRPVAVERLRAELAEAEALLLCVPEYAGTVPGALKNVLDWTVGGTEMNGLPTAWINVAAPGRGQGAIATLRTVLGYVDAAIVDDACADIPVPRDAVSPDGDLVDAGLREQLVAAARRLLAATAPA